MRVQKDYKGKSRRDAHFVGISQVKQGYWNFACKLLPYSAFPCSAFVELTAVAVFAMNIFDTLLHPPPISALKFIPYLPHEVPLDVTQHSFISMCNFIFEI